MTKDTEEYEGNNIVSLCAQISDLSSGLLSDWVVEKCTAIHDVVSKISNEA